MHALRETATLRPQRAPSLEDTGEDGELVQVVLAVAAGGALGAVSRYALSSGVTNLLDLRGSGTFVANILGAFVRSSSAVGHLPEYLLLLQRWKCKGRN